MKRSLVSGPVLAALAGLAAGAHAQSPRPAPVCGACSSYGALRIVGTLQEAALTETSGLAASRVHPGVYYAHNDSGDTPRFFAIDAAGTRRGEFTVTGATAIDWEDVAVGPCDGGSCVFLGDIGDNHAQRATSVIYRVREPAMPADPRAITPVAAARIEFAYPDRPHDAEALAVDPRSGGIYVFTKQLGRSRVYRVDAPERAGARVAARFVTELTIRGGMVPMVTAADIHPCGARVLLRTYTGALEFIAPSHGSIEDALAYPPTPVPAAPEFQSEAIAYRADGRGYVTVPEGAGAVIHEVSCRPP